MRVLGSLTVAALAALAVPEAAGYSMYAAKVPNGDKVPGVTALGHMDPVLAGPMNEFGMDMIDAEFTWTKEFCQKDSDGDGQTNGQELGDPCCEFVHRKNAVVRWVEGISHPGDAALMSDPALWAGIVCEEAADTKEEAATIANATTDEEMEVQGEAGDEEETVAPVKKVDAAEEMTDGAKLAAETGAEEKETDGAAPALVSSTVLSAAVILSALAFVAVRMRRRQRGWSLLPHQQGRRAH
ncbi:hypothetical protein BBJ28_00020839 [Nothophytophthora sp. Chile5]|nr:hypothetical protein BBJ28_00020839 [Nothophytophthora sp. Chile5]